MGGRISIIVSLCFGLALIAGVVLTRTEVTADTDIEDPRNFVAALPLREYQEPTDKDGDGLRDWLEELTGTDPEVNDAVRIASSSSSTAPFVADTETERFALSFFEEMLNQHGGDGLTSQETQAVLQKSLSEFRSLNENTLYNRTNITIDEDLSLRDYGNTLGKALLDHNTKPTGTEHELVILGRALREDDPLLMKDMAIIRGNYEGMTGAAKEVGVPTAAIDAHIALINSLQAVTDDVVAFEKTFEDPLVAYLRIKRYQDDVRALALSIEKVRSLLESEGTVYRNDEPGQLFFTFRP